MTPEERLIHNLFVVGQHPRRIAEHIKKHGLDGWPPEKAAIFQDVDAAIDQHQETPFDESTLEVLRELVELEFIELNPRGSHDRHYVQKLIRLRRLQPNKLEPTPTADELLQAFRHFNKP